MDDAPTGTRTNTNPSAVQSVTSRYTDCAIPAPGQRVRTFFLITGIPNLVRRPVFRTEYYISESDNFHLQVISWGGTYAAGFAGKNYLRH
jgi:hypothetical protein